MKDEGTKALQGVPDYLIVGEVRGEEAKSFFEAFYSKPSMRDKTEDRPKTN